MRKGDIDRFFREAAKEIRTPVRIYLTGGIASWFLGGDRPTEDIDFGLRASEGKWMEVEGVIQGVSRKLGIPVQFSEDIGRWGMIGILDYEKGARLYKRFGKVSVYLLDVGVWSVGKMNRYYQSDVDDLRAVLKKQRPDSGKLVTIWARALRESPRSSSSVLFVKTVEDFLKNYGQEIWGSRFNSEETTRKFRQTSPRQVVG